MRLPLLTPEGVVYRISYMPDPWAWVPWESSPFTGRWDDPQDVYRTLYAASSPAGCFVEILAQFRPDSGIVDELDSIKPDARDDDYPSLRPGEVPTGWVNERRLGSARLDGAFVDICHAETISALRPIFLRHALALGLPDFDAAALRIARRPLTSQLSRFLYGAIVDNAGLTSGIAFASRHGDDLRLWAIFERDADVHLDRSHLLSACTDEPIDLDNAALRYALELHRLRLRSDVV